MKAVKIDGGALIYGSLAKDCNELKTDLVKIREAQKESRRRKTTRVRQHILP